MGLALFTNGSPARITAQDFLRYHRMQFPRLGRPENLPFVEDAIDDVYAIFKGIPDIWNWLDNQTWYDKTTKCYRLLTAWYLADLYPTMSSGVPGMGGVPLKRKKIGPVDITFADGSTNLGKDGWLDILSSLRSNPFGGKAYLMITASGKRLRIFSATTI